MTYSVAIYWGDLGYVWQFASASSTNATLSKAYLAGDRSPLLLQFLMYSIFPARDSSLFSKHRTVLESMQFDLR